MMKLMTPYRKQDDLQIYKDHHFSSLVISHKDLSLRSDEYFDIAEINEISRQAQEIDVNLYLKVNKFFFEPEIEGLNDLLKSVIETQLTGIILSDFGVFTLLKELEYEGEIILETDTTMTSSNDINVLYEAGFNEMVVARELTLEEISEIAEKTLRPISVHVFGHQVMSTSRRHLLSAYNEQVGTNLKQNTRYSMREKTRPNSHYLVTEDENGTHMFDGEVLNGLADAHRLMSEAFRHLIIDSFNLSDDVIFDVGDTLALISHNLSNTQQLSEEFEKRHPEIRFGRALWDTKTSETKENVK